MYIYIYIYISLISYNQIYIIGCGYNHSFALINPRNIKRKIGEVDGIKEEDEKEVKKAKQIIYE